MSSPTQIRNSVYLMRHVYVQLYYVSEYSGSLTNSSQISLVTRSKSIDSLDLKKQRQLPLLNPSWYSSYHLSSEILVHYCYENMRLPIPRSQRSFALITPMPICRFSVENLIHFFFQCPR